MTEKHIDVAAHVDAPTNRNKIIAAGAAGALLLAGGGYALLSGGGSDTAQPLPIRHRVVQPALPAAAQAVAKPAALLPPASKAQLGRDPFKALYVEPVAPVAAAGTSATGTSSTGTSSTGTSSTGTSSTGTSSTGTSSTGAPATSAKYSLKLASVALSKGSRNFTFTYQKASKQVVVGQRFGAYGEVVVLGSTSSTTGRVTGALLQIGDDDPIAIALGESLTVQ